MARSQNSFNKKEREKKKAQKRKEKVAKKLERKESGGDGDRMVYLDANGNFVDTPPDETEKTEVDETSIQISTPKSAPIDMDAVREGKVTFFNDQRGYGFIEQNGTQEKFYVHISQTTIVLKIGHKVKFQIEKGDRGFNAVNVQVVK